MHTKQKKKYVTNIATYHHKTEPSSLYAAKNPVKKPNFVDTTPGVELDTAKTVLIFSSDICEPKTELKKVHNHLKIGIKIYHHQKQKVKLKSIKEY
ncbi:hypothetical protein NW733_00875 [Mycoplasmopsis felis]|uniref:hypothetical protein n=1 Tax=Mycoplasmopsis felis TaxID=33923 RepID=UPI0021DF5117|nr:hypothetical protein [Mycoplasmopsis felis]MCU9931309.1 hypothetical protein [Mycoplasmopsis felis]